MIQAPQLLGAWQFKTTHLYSFITMVGWDDPVVCEHHVERVARPPPLEVNWQGSVGLCVPLSHLLKPVQDVAYGEIKYKD